MLCFVFLGVMLVSCQENEITTTPETTEHAPRMEDAEWYPQYQQYLTQLEPDRSPLPTFEDLKKITVGMPFTEAYEIAGAAQRKDSKVLVDMGHPQTSARPIVTYFIHDTQEGIKVKIRFLPAYYVDENEYQNKVMGVTCIYPDGYEENLTRNTQ